MATGGFVHKVGDGTVPGDGIGEGALEVIAGEAEGFLDLIAVEDGVGEPLGLAFGGEFFGAVGDGLLIAFDLVELVDGALELLLGAGDAVLSAGGIGLGFGGGEVRLAGRHDLLRHGKRGDGGRGVDRGMGWGLR